MSRLIFLLYYDIPITQFTVSALARRRESGLGAVRQVGSADLNLLSRSQVNLRLVHVFRIPPSGGMMTALQGGWLDWHSATRITPATHESLEEFARKCGPEPVSWHWPRCEAAKCSAGACRLRAKVEGAPEGAAFSAFCLRHLRRRCGARARNERLRLPALRSLGFMTGV